MSQTIGTQSIQFDEAPYILGSASIVGTKEGEGPLGKLFYLVGEVRGRHLGRGGEHFAERSGCHGDWQGRA